MARKASRTALAGLDELDGLHGLSRGRDLLRDQKRRPVELASPTSSPLDAVLGGGLPRGSLVELVGRPRYSLVLQVLAARTRAAEPVALVDLGDGFDPRTAERCGVDLPFLLWIRPSNMRQALTAAEVTLDSGIPLVVVELGVPPLPGGRGREPSWVRLARSARDRSAALLVSTPYRVVQTAAEIVVRSRVARNHWTTSSPARPPVGASTGTLPLTHTCLLEGISALLEPIKDRRPGHPASSRAVPFRCALGE